MTAEPTRMVWVFWRELYIRRMQVIGGRIEIRPADIQNLQLRPLLRVRRAVMGHVAVDVRGGERQDASERLQRRSGSNDTLFSSSSDLDEGNTVLRLLKLDRVLILGFRT